MTQWYFPFADNNGDRTYNDADFAKFFSSLFTTGIFANVGDALQVTQSSSLGMRVTIGSGAAIINGRQYFNTEATSLDIAPASALQDRLDKIFVRLDLAARTIGIVYNQGNREPERTELVYELQIAAISVKQNATNIHNSDINDTRSDSNYAGYSSPFEKVPVDGLVSQYEDKLNSFYLDSQSDFQTWFTNLQDQLDDNQAANLQHQIDTLTAALDTKANDSDVLHTTGDESFQGNKTFTNGVVQADALVAEQTLTVNGTASVENLEVSGYADIFGPLTAKGDFWANGSVNGDSRKLNTVYNPSATFSFVASFNNSGANSSVVRVKNGWVYHYVSVQVTGTINLDAQTQVGTISGIPMPWGSANAYAPVIDISGGTNVGFVGYSPDGKIYLNMNSGTSLKNDYLSWVLIYPY